MEQFRLEIVRCSFCCWSLTIHGYSDPRRSTYRVERPSCLELRCRKWYYWRRFRYLSLSLIRFLAILCSFQGFLRFETHWLSRLSFLDWEPYRCCGPSSFVRGNFYIFSRSCGNRLWKHPPHDIWSQLRFWVIIRTCGVLRAFFLRHWYHSHPKRTTFLLL